MSPAPLSSATFVTTVVSFFVINITLLLILVTAVCPFYFLGWVRALTFVYVPYYTWTQLVSPLHLKDGYQSPWFALHFPLFNCLRKMSDFTVTTPSKAFQLAEAKPGAQFIFAFFPHGADSSFRIQMEGLLPTFLPNISSKVRALAASVLFTIPIIREISLFTGCISASRKIADRCLQRGNSVIVIPGGEAEQLLTECGKEIIFLKSRKGFIKLGIVHGIPLVPAYTFGQNDVFATSNACYGIR
jgi:hypothetical protein